MPQQTTVSFNVHANSNDPFNPRVHSFASSGEEVITLDLTGDTGNVFLNRERLHQLKDVLVAACERYPMAVADEKAATWADKYRPALAEGR